MRKIAALILILAALTYVDGVNNTWSGTSGNGKWSTAALWSTAAAPVRLLDTALFDVTSVFPCTTDVAWNLPKVVVGADYSGTWRASGKSDTIQSLFSFSGTGTNHFGTLLVLNSFGKIFFAAGMGAQTDYITKLIFNGTNDTLTDNKGITFYSGTSTPVLTIGDGASLINNGTANTTLYGNMPYTIGSNGKLIINKRFLIRMTSSGTFPSTASGAICSTTVDMHTYLYATNIYDTMNNLRIRYLANANPLSSPVFAFYYDNNGAGTNYFTFLGNDTFSNIQCTATGISLPKALIYNQIGNIIALDLSMGTDGSNTASFTANFAGNAKILTYNKRSTFNSSAAVQTINFLSSINTCDSAFIALTNHTYIPATSRWTFSSTRLTALTTAAKNPLFYDFEVNKSSAAACSLTTGILYVADSGVVIAGRFVDNGLQSYFMNLRIASTDTSNFTGTRNINQDYIRTAGSRIKNNDSGLIRFDSAYNSRLWLGGNRTGRVRIVKTTSAYGLTLQDSPDTMRSLKDSVGYVVQNKKVVVCTTLVALDSAQLDTSLFVYDTFRLAEAAKIGATDTVNFIGGTASECYDSSHQLNVVNVNKTANTPMNFWSTLKATVLNLISGRTTVNDRAYVSSLNITAVDTTRFKAPLYDTGVGDICGGIILLDSAAHFGDSLIIGVCTGYFRANKPVTVVGDVTVTNPDSVAFDDSLYVGENLTLAAGIKARFTLIAFTGTTQSPITTNGNHVGYWIVQGTNSTKEFSLVDPLSIDSLKDTIGYMTIGQNLTVCKLWVYDSAYINATVNITCGIGNFIKGPNAKIKYGPNAKIVYGPFYTSPEYLLLHPYISERVGADVPAIWTDSTRSLVPTSPLPFLGWNVQHDYYEAWTGSKWMPFDSTSKAKYADSSAKVNKGYVMDSAGGAARLGGSAKAYFDTVGAGAVTAALGTKRDTSSHNFRVDTATAAARADSVIHPVDSARKVNHLVVLDSAKRSGTTAVADSTAKLPRDYTAFQWNFDSLYSRSAYLPLLYGASIYGYKPGSFPELWWAILTQNGRMEINSITNDLYLSGASGVTIADSLNMLYGKARIDTLIVTKEINGYIDSTSKVPANYSALDWSFDSLFSRTAKISGTIFSAKDSTATLIVTTKGYVNHIGNLTSGHVVTIDTNLNVTGNLDITKIMYVYNTAGDFFRTNLNADNSLRWAFSNSAAGVFSISDRGDDWVSGGDSLTIDRSGNGVLTGNFTADTIKGLTAKFTDLSRWYYPLHRADDTGLIDGHVWDSAGHMIVKLPQEGNYTMTYNGDTIMNYYCGDGFGINYGTETGSSVYTTFWGDVRVGSNGTTGGNLAVDGSIDAGGDLSVGGGLQIKVGANSRMDTITLVSGTATISNTSVTAVTNVIPSYFTVSGTPGTLYKSAVVASTSYTITSTAGITDNSKICCLLIEPAP